MIIKAVKKPIEVEAMQFIYSKEGLQNLKNFCGDSMGDYHKNRNLNSVGEVEIKTLEDGTTLKVKHVAREGDYIIKGSFGEFWAVRKEIFESTYQIIQ